LALVFVPWEYRVEARGRLFPNEKRTVFAPWDGTVVSVMVQGGQRVRAGQPLLRLRNDDLHAELLTRQNELNEKRKAVVSRRAQIDEAVRIDDRKDAIRLRGQVAETMIEIDGLIEQIEILNERKEQLSVRAPQAGIVVTFQGELEQLTDRPVGRGEVLLEIMEDTGDWHLELEVDDRRMGHILEAQQALGQTNLSVEFIAATSPEQTYRGTLQMLGTRTETSAEEGNVVPIVVSVDAKAIRHRRVGAEVRAKIDCGECSLGYVLFGDVIETVRRFFWM
jgi:multidrug efflux pump subunit AcrA (membrane-fusion protein)